jgi:hypothetical protein
MLYATIGRDGVDLARLIEIKIGAGWKKFTNN